MFEALVQVPKLTDHEMDPVTFRGALHVSVLELRFSQTGAGSGALLAGELSSHQQRHACQQILRFLLFGSCARQARIGMLEI